VKTPRPQTKWAVLWCDALKRPSLHHYARTDELMQADDFDTEGRWQQSFEHIFRCAETGAPRRWGVEAVRIRYRIQKAGPMHTNAAPATSEGGVP
jgi:hypothetical protein